MVSTLGLGAMMLGVRADRRESFAIVDSALEAGINFVDTANV
jgi:NDP-hexose 2,3-enoyl reductase